MQRRGRFVIGAHEELLVGQDRQDSASAIGFKANGIAAGKGGFGWDGSARSGKNGHLFDSGGNEIEFGHELELTCFENED